MTKPLEHKPARKMQPMNTSRLTSKTKRTSLGRIFLIIVTAVGGLVVIGILWFALVMNISNAPNNKITKYIAAAYPEVNIPNGWSLTDTQEQNPALGESTEYIGWDYTYQTGQTPEVARSTIIENNPSFELMEKPNYGKPSIRLVNTEKNLRLEVWFEDGVAKIEARVNNAERVTD